ncbi:MAG: S-layer protein [Cyanobacteria bacterium QH_3_48_40]|nr:MAG: S-layer protein [Cyanobacteria bacterium QH_3_48_40]
MSKLLWNVVKVTPAVLGASLFVSNGALGAEDKINAAFSSDNSSFKLTDSTLSQATPASESAPSETLEQIQQYSGEGNSNSNGNSMNQVNSVSEFSDVSPDDWAYEALRNLVERYGCIEGYPDGSFRGNRALTRYEFAAGLNSCLQQIERLIAAEGKEGGGQQVAPEDLETLERLVQEFQAELATLGTRVDNIEARTETLEENQFSTTTKLNGEVIFALSDIFGGEDVVTPDGEESEVDGNTVFQDRVRLNFDTSFTGEDLLRTRLEAENVQDFESLSDTGGEGITREGQLGFDGNNENDIEIDELYYQFPIGNAAEITVAGADTEVDDLVSTVLNPALASSGNGAVSRFGRFNPIYRIGAQGAGASFTFGPEAPISLSGGYLAGDPSDPSRDSGVGDGSYSAFGQVTFKPSERFQIAATYVNSYSEGFNYDAGSIGSQVEVNGSDGTVPVVGNSYGVEASFGLTDNIILSGWGGYTDAIVLGRGDATVWNYAGTLAIQDFGTEGSTLAFVVGQEPKLTEAESTLGLEEDEDTGLHVEGLYKWQVTDNISVTPGVIWLTAPGHNDDNDDVFVGTVRTTFSF